MYIRHRNYKNGEAQVEFELGGKRHRPVVSATNDREAKRQGELARKAMKAELAESKKIVRHARNGVSLLLGDIFPGYFRELTGSEFQVDPRTLPEHHAQAHSALSRMLVWFDDRGVRTIDAIDDEAVSGLVRWASAQYRYDKQIRDRAAKQNRVPTDAELKQYGLVSPNQVHSMTTKRLQCVFGYARDILKLDLMGSEPNWRKRRPKVHKKAPRVLDDSEHILLERTLPEGFGKFFEFCIATPLRKSEAFIRWSDYSAQRRTITRVVKGGAEELIPLTAKACDIIESCRGDHPVFVFTYLCRHGDSRRRQTRGERYPINKSNLGQAWRTARRLASVNIPWHRATRATGATEICGAGGGTRGAQLAMGHAEEATTRGYLGGVRLAALPSMEAADVVREARLAALREQMPTEDQMLLPAPAKKARR